MERYFSFYDFERKAPGPLVKTTKELIEEIEKLERNGFVPDDNFEAFVKRFCYLEDGHASKRVVERLFK